MFNPNKYYETRISLLNGFIQKYEAFCTNPRRVKPQNVLEYARTELDNHPFNAFLATLDHDFSVILKEIEKLEKKSLTPPPTSTQKPEKPAEREITFIDDDESPFKEAPPIEEKFPFIKTPVKPAPTEETCFKTPDLPSVKAKTPEFKTPEVINLDSATPTTPIQNSAKLKQSLNSSTPFSKQQSDTKRKFYECVDKILGTSKSIPKAIEVEDPQQNATFVISNNLEAEKQEQMEDNEDKENRDPSGNLTRVLDTTPVSKKLNNSLGTPISKKPSNVIQKESQGTPISKKPSNVVLKELNGTPISKKPSNVIQQDSDGTFILEKSSKEPQGTPISKKPSHLSHTPSTQSEGTPVSNDPRVTMDKLSSPVILIERHDELENRLSMGVPTSPKSEEKEPTPNSSVGGKLRSSLKMPNLLKNTSMGLNKKKISIPPQVNKLMMEKQRADIIKQRIEEKEAKSKLVLEQKKAEKQAKLQESKAKFDEVQKKIKMKKFLEEKSSNIPSVSGSTTELHNASKTSIGTTQHQPHLVASTAMTTTGLTTSSKISKKLSFIKKSLRTSNQKPVIKSMAIDYLNSDESDNENDNTTNPYSSWAVSEKMVELREILRTKQVSKPPMPSPEPYFEDIVFGKYFYRKKVRTSSIVWDD